MKFGLERMVCVVSGARIAGYGKESSAGDDLPVV